MSAKNIQPGNRRGATTSRLAELEKQCAAVQEQRTRDQMRLSMITKERDLLKFELAQSAVSDARPTWMTSPCHVTEMEQHQPVNVDPWLLKPAAVRARLREEHIFPASVFTRLTASLLLRFARIAARNKHYAIAEVLYQTILFLAPRAFVWRQAGNMLAGQGLFSAAIDCFDQAILMDESDSEAWHARAVAFRRLDRDDESRQSLSRALSLDPSLADRKIP